MSFLDRIQACRRHDMANYRPFLVGGHEVGWVKHEVAETLEAHPEVFHVESTGVTLADSLATPQARTAAVARVFDTLRPSGLVAPLRDEAFGVVTSWGETPLFLVDRSALDVLGIASFGIHLNGYVHREDGLHLWVGHRSQEVRTAPGKLDHLVAGGQPHGLGLRENLEKEGAEEASLPASLVAQAHSCGAISYRLETEHGLNVNTLFTYDLELPADFVPKNTDGEVEAFELWPVERVAERVRDTDDFKFNVAPVLIDFFVRHGVLTPDDDDYLAVVHTLRGPA